MLGPGDGTTQISAASQKSAPHAKLSKRLAVYTAVLVILFLGMWTLLGEEEVTIVDNLAKISEKLPGSLDDPLHPHNSTLTNPSENTTLAPSTSVASPTSPPTSSPTSPIENSPPNPIQPLQPGEINLGTLLDSVKFDPSTNTLYQRASTSPSLSSFVIPVRDGKQSFEFQPEPQKPLNLSCS